MEKSKIKVIIVSQDKFFWQEVSSLLKDFKNVEFYPKDENDFFDLKLLLFWSLKISTAKELKGHSEKRIMHILSENVENETLFIINNQLFTSHDEITAYNFYQTYLIDNYNVPIIVTYNRKNERGLNEFKKINDFGHKIVSRNGELAEKLNDLFNF